MPAPQNLIPPPRKLLITGGNGYIGKALVDAAQLAGWNVRVLGKPPAPTIEAFPWRLGDEVPAEAFHDVTAVIHLAHQWHKAGTPTTDINIKGTKLLLDACRRNKVPRFVMASTISAQEYALNHYGREKWHIEQLLNAPQEFRARIGLVYGRHEHAMWGMICRLAKLPLLPMVGTDRLVQPIALDELSQGLLKLAVLENPQRAWYGLATAKGISFGDVLRTISRQKYGKHLFLINVPLPLVLFIVRIVQKIIPAINTERVYGLIGLPFVDCQSSLDELGLSISPMIERLGAIFRTRRLLDEARIVLRYCFCQKPPLSMVRNYVRGVVAYGGDRALTFPVFTKMWPPLLRICEPLGKKTAGSTSTLRTTLASRLEMASIIVESEPSGAARMYAYERRNPIRVATELGLTFLVEGLLLPVRILTNKLWVRRG